MSENKRFELTHFDCDYITDHLTGEDYPTIDKDSMFELVKQINELVDENEELKQEVELVRFGLNKYESLLPQYLNCGEINSFHSDLFEFQIKQLKFYKEHPNLVKQVTIIDGGRIDD